jgi:hypothetical protein
VEGNNAEGNAKCNRFIDTYMGTVFDGTMMTFGVSVPGPNTHVAAFESGGDHDNAKNEWISSVPGYLPDRAISQNSADASTIIWWHDPGPITFDMPLSTISAIGGGIPLTPDTGNPFADCTDPTEPEGRDTFFLTTTQQAALDAIEAGTRSLGSNDPIYALLASRLRLESIHPQVARVAESTLLPTLLEAQREWLDGNLKDLSAVPVLPIGDEEAAWLRAFSVRTAAQERWLMEPDTAGFGHWSSKLTDEERDFLEALAMESPAEFGEPVFWAQSFLNRTIIQDQWQMASARAAAEMAQQDQIGFAYPNPTTGLLVLSFEGEGGPLRLLDLEGRVIKEWPSVRNGQFIGLDGLPDGTYVLRLIKDTGGELVHRVVLQGAAK